MREKGKIATKIENNRNKTVKREKEVGRNTKRKIKKKRKGGKRHEKETSKMSEIAKSAPHKTKYPEREVTIKLWREKR